MLRYRKRSRIYGFLAIHLEPDAPPYQNNNWNNLVGIIALCDQYRAKATLLMTPQWADWFQNNDDKRAILKTWVDNRHEIGLHHHGYSAKSLPAGWDGYSALASPLVTGDIEYNGNMQLAFSKVQDVVNDVLDTNVPSRSGGVTDAEVDWVPPLRYRVTSGGALSTPEFDTAANITVIRSTYGTVVVGSGEETVSSLTALLPSAKMGDRFGLVLHDEDGGDVATMANLEEILVWMRNTRIRIIPIRAALSGRP